MFVDSFSKLGNFVSSKKTAPLSRYLWCQGFVIESSPVNHWFLIVDHVKVTTPSLNFVHFSRSNIFAAR